MWLDGRPNKYTQELFVALAYPANLLIGVLLSWIVSEDTKEQQRQSIYILNSQNIINSIFAYKGNIIWTILFASIALAQIYVRSRKFEVLPITNLRQESRFDNIQVLIYGKQYAIKYILKLIILLVCFVIIDHVFIATGGECSDGNQSMGLHSAEGCRKKGGDWIGGFDISGHFCFLMNISLILWCELFIYINHIKEHSIEAFINPWINRGLYLITAVLAIWYMLLFITSIYYHTLFEKILGCILGYACCYIMYYVIPNHYILNKYLYE